MCQPGNQSVLFRQPRVNHTYTSPLLKCVPPISLTMSSPGGPAFLCQRAYHLMNYPPLCPAQYSSFLSGE